jgi:Ca2+-binding RTX toxin-like protein
MIRIPGDDFMANLVGTPGNDRINGTEVNDTLQGLAGNDILRGLTGVDFLYGGDGNDELRGGQGNDHLDGGAGNDTIYAFDSGAASDGSTADWIDGGDGQDTLIVQLATSSGVGGVVLITNIDPGGVTHASNGLTFRNVENLSITGTGAADRIDGGDGNDTISGGGGSHIFGRGGDDLLTLTGHGGALVGGDGNDTLFSQVGGGRLQGGNGDDTLHSLDGSDRLDGDAGNDTLIGENGVDALYGGDGNDTLAGDFTYNVSDGPQVYLSFIGNDVLQGGAGDDVLIGGRGKDTLTGGAGADRFTYYVQDSLPGAGTRDVITDFSQAEGDRIDLSHYLVLGFRSSDTIFTFIGTAAFTGTEPTLDTEGNLLHYNGQANYRYDGTSTVISGDANGDKVADFEIVLLGHITPTAADFVL